MPKVIRVYLPIIVTILLLYFVVRRVGLGELVAVVRGANLGWVLIACVVAHVIYLPNLLKWQLLLRAQGHEVALPFLFKLSLVGTFFNNMLPTNVGGDVIRSYEVGRRIEDPATGLATVFVERLSGLVVLTAFAVVAFLTHLDDINSPVLLVAILLACVGLAGLTWLAVDSALLAMLERRLPVGSRPWLAKLRKFQTALHRYKGRRGVLAKVLVLSIVFYAGAVTYSFTALSAFAESVDLLGTIFVVPITMVVAMMPISFNGVGLQEWSFVLLFPLIGVAPSAALSAMLLIRGIAVLSSIVGGLLYLHMKARGSAGKGTLASPPERAGIEPVPGSTAREST